MWFWVFMVVMNLLIPFTMIGFGRYFMKTWEFAHRLCGKIWYRAGWILLPLSVVPMMFVSGKDADTVGTLGGIISLIQIIPLIGSIIPVEHALKRAFDENGMPRACPPK